MKNWILIPLFFTTIFTQAQSYSSLRLEEIGNEVKKFCLPKTDSIFNCPKIIRGKSLIVTYNKKREIDHLGISMFSNETKELINLPVCNFIERFLLELVLEKTPRSAMQRLNRFKISIKRNGIEFGNPRFLSLTGVLNEIKNPVSFSLHKNPEKFAAEWEFNHNQFVILFPATRDLIFGTDKKESDELLNISLSDDSKLCSSENDRSGDDVSENSLIYNSQKDIFTKRGNDFTLQLINSNTYYKKTDDGFDLIFSQDYPEESLSNLIIKNMGNLNHKLHITHRMYGNFSPDFDISLKKFLCVFKDDFEVFTAVSSSNQDELKLTVVLRSKDYNYVHLLLINTTKETVFKNDGILNANFYSNIPQQSIKSLIGDLK